MSAWIKILCLLVYLVFVGTAQPFHTQQFLWYAAFVTTAAIASRTPLPTVLSRASMVLPVTFVFCLVSVASGELTRAWMFLAKSFLSGAALAVLIVSTPQAKLMQGAEQLGTPRILIQVIQFLLQYLSVLQEKARNIRQAAACRGGLRLDAAAGAVAVLFGSTHRRAEGVHQAMLARGFEGHFVPMQARKATWKDAVALLALAASLLAGRYQWGI